MAESVRSRGWRATAVLAVILLALLVAPGGGARALQLVETPSLAAQVASKRLPSVAERVPATPLVVEFKEPWAVIGRSGGELRTLTRARDPQMLVELGYTRLVGYDATLQLVPDLLESVTVEDGRRFTLHLRPGHKWSDGRAFTAEDFRYWWEDVANNPALSPGGPPKAMLVDGEPPRFTIIDATTVRYGWAAPNPEFLPALAAGEPLVIYRPAHYLRAFHVRHADRRDLARTVAAAGATDWAALHNRRDTTYSGANPDMPVLGPWVNTTLAPAGGFIGLRNPYFHRVDREGRQLPYIDRVVLTRPAGEQIVAATVAGETQLQALGLAFADLPALADAAARGGFDVRPWPSARGSTLALYPNVNAQDIQFRNLNRDLRFRRALSLGIDRAKLSAHFFAGKAIRGGNALLPASPLHRAADREAWAQYDPRRANQLLDEAGLAQRDAHGVRLLSDGRPLDLPVAFSDDDPVTADVLSAIHEQLDALGVRLVLLPTPRDVLRRRVQSGEVAMSAGAGLVNGLANADSSPAEWVPSDDRQRQWPLWGRFVETGGRAGEAPTDAHALRLIDLHRQWRAATTPARKTAAWHEITGEAADAVVSIGIVAMVPQPVIVDRKLRNVPLTAPFHSEPGLQIGLYRADQFWFER
jgi:peptide/nickel transport system substrate-binding protein